PAEAGTEVVGLDLDHGSLLALLVLPGTLLQPAGHYDPAAARERLGGVLRQAPPAVDREERRVAVRPVAGRVTDPRGIRDPEVGHRGAVRRVAQLGIIREVANDRDLVVARHGAVPLLGLLRLRGGGGSG